MRRPESGPFTRRRPGRQHLDGEQRLRLAEAIATGRALRGWSAEQLARQAQSRIRSPSPAEEEHATTTESRRWSALSVTAHQVRAFESPANNAHPLGLPERRARLLGIVLALGDAIDRQAVNRAAGGI